MKTVANEQIYDENILIEQFLIYLEQQLNEFYIKLFQIGITIKDLDKLIEIESDIRVTIENLEEKIKICHREIQDIAASIVHCHPISRSDVLTGYEKKQIEKQKLLSMISDLENMDKRFLDILYESKYQLEKIKFFKEDAVYYIMDNTSLLHLIYTNNTYPKIKPYSTSSYMFLCQLHKEKTPSFGVTPHKNLSHCYGCGFGGNQITYIMEYENYSFIETIYFLAEIYLIEIPDNPFKNNKNVEKYRKVLLSDEYMNFINSSIERLEKNESNDSQNSLKWYKNHIESIKRIKNRHIDTTIKDNCKNVEKIYKKSLTDFYD